MIARNGISGGGLRSAFFIGIMNNLDLSEKWINSDWMPRIAYEKIFNWIWENNGAIIKVSLDGRYGFELDL